MDYLDQTANNNRYGAQVVGLKVEMAPYEGKNSGISPKHCIVQQVGEDEDELHFKWLPYSPDLAPSEFYMLTSLKNAHKRYFLSNL